ncbi:MAG: hypothetical protein DI623_02980 [Sphingomonas sanxanigenens]|uniref:Ice-binding protein C-terminal domain-containing protein n=1 Tax=Sphingomonas sanxanigenens TaxID=397260 RepID=A0A2W5AA50_9SPHN|nr:MAG: hypothetical protein DI623_02980 [Sphingomonas sanxanigenens]
MHNSIFGMVALAILAPTPAKSASLDYQFSHEVGFSGQIGGAKGWEIRDAVPLFDSALGQLLSATLEAKITYTFSLDWDATAATRGAIYTYGDYQAIIYQDPTLEPMVNTGLTSINAPVAMAGTSGRWDGVQSYELSYTLTDAAQLAKLTGLGFYDQILFSHINMFAENDIVDGPASTDVGANMKVDYTLRFAYVNAGVPEPATWAMLLIGFAASGVAIRRRSGSPSAQPIVR